MNGEISQKYAQQRRRDAVQQNLLVSTRRQPKAGQGHQNEDHRWGQDRAIKYPNLPLDHQSILQSLKVMPFLLHRILITLHQNIRNLPRRIIGDRSELLPILLQPVQLQRSILVHGHRLAQHHIAVLGIKRPTLEVHLAENLLRQSVRAVMHPGTLDLDIADTGEPRAGRFQRDRVHVDFRIPQVVARDVERSKATVVGGFPLEAKVLPVLEGVRSS